MKIELAKNVRSLTGFLTRANGIYIRSKTKKDGTKVFYASKRNHRQKIIPPDGHWQFIRLCAEMAQKGNYIADIIVPRSEFLEAYYTAHHFVPRCTLPAVLHAHDIIGEMVNENSSFHSINS